MKFNVSLALHLSAKVATPQPELSATNASPELPSTIILYANASLASIEMVPNVPAALINVLHVQQVPSVLPVPTTILEV